jgi:hypothetical protein
MRLSAIFDRNFIGETEYFGAKSRVQGYEMGLVAVAGTAEQPEDKFAG